MDFFRQIFEEKIKSFLFLSLSLVKIFFAKSLVKRNWIIHVLTQIEIKQEEKTIKLTL